MHQSILDSFFSIGSLASTHDYLSYASHWKHDMQIRHKIYFIFIHFIIKRCLRHAHIFYKQWKWFQFRVSMVTMNFQFRFLLSFWNDDNFRRKWFFLDKRSVFLKIDFEVSIQKLETDQRWNKKKKKTQQNWENRRLTEKSLFRIKQ